MGTALQTINFYLTSLPKLGGCLGQSLISEALNLISTGWQSRHLLTKISFISNTVRSAVAVTDVSIQEHRTRILLRLDYLTFDAPFQPPRILLWNSGLSSLLYRSVIYPKKNSHNNFVSTFVVCMPDNFRRIRDLLCKCVGIARTYMC